MRKPEKGSLGEGQLSFRPVHHPLAGDDEDQNVQIGLDMGVNVFPRGQPDQVGVELPT